MSDKKKLTLALLSIFFVLIVFYLINMYLQKIPKNPSGTVGNTAGNLNNGGYFCESDGVVYFSNAYDNDTLYCMNPDETNIRALNLAQVSQINAAGNYLYYYQKNATAYPGFSFIVRTYGLYRTNKKGKKPICLEKTDCKYVALADNTLLYSKPEDGVNTLVLHAIGTDKKNRHRIDSSAINPSSVTNSLVYYNATKDNHHLYVYDTLSDVHTLVKEYDMWFPTIHGQYIYFLNLEGNYELCRYQISDGSILALTTDSVEAFNLTENYIYYQTMGSESPALMRMGLDGSNPEIVCEGVYRDINTTSSQVYFRAYGADTPVYHTPANGPISVSTFEGAAMAAMKNTNN